jgi:RNA recognition motif-containing protein
MEPQYESVMTLYVNNLNEKVNRKELKRRLSLLITRYVRMKEIRLYMRGRAFVNFYSMEDALFIKENLHDLYFMKKKISVQFAKSQMGKIKARKDDVDGITPSKVIVLSNIPKNISKEEIERVFLKLRGCEGVRYVGIKSLAFIDFDSMESSANAYKSVLEKPPFTGMKDINVFYFKAGMMQ